MGIIYAPQDVKKGFIPNPEDYLDAKEILKKRFIEDLFPSGKIHAVKFMGSASDSIDPPGFGSDLDVFIIAESNKHLSEMGELRKEIRYETRVVTEFSGTTRDLAQNGFHGTDSFFKKYLESCEGEIIGSNPVNELKSKRSWEDPRSELKTKLEYQIIKMQKLRMNSIDFTELCRQALEKSIRQPFFAAINHFMVEEYEEGRGFNYPLIDGRQPTKPEIYEIYKKRFPGPTSDSLYNILEIRTKYKTFDPKTENIKSYRELLNRVRNNLPNSLMFMSSVLENLESGA